ncbi:hypothetical protein N7453_004833 [Penicillium expansum]|nr:hypothetical protein N7453_004833 [Penicillium expansum]
MSCLSPDASSTITSRPKLTLQTTSLPRTSASVIPTVRNTFKNAYEVASPSSATSPTKPSRYNKPSSPYILHPNNNIFNHRSPYQLPIGVRSILRNSPLEPSARRRSGSISAGGNGPNGAGTRRVFFPAKKQVSYRYPLEEEIRTERYTAQHLDLVTEEEEAVQAEADTNSNSPSETRPAPFQNLEGEKETSDSSPSLSETSTSDDTSADEGVRGSSLSKMERKKRRTMRTERQEWKWTLGPVDLSGDKASNDFGSENVSLLHAAQGNSGSETLRVSTDFAPSH